VTEVSCFLPQPRRGGRTVCGRGSAALGGAAL